MPEESVSRETVRPGLTLVKRRTWKEDGRLLLYFEFEREEPRAEEADGAMDGGADG